MVWYALLTLGSGYNGASGESFIAVTVDFSLFVARSYLLPDVNWLCHLAALPSSQVLRTCLPGVQGTLFFFGSGSEVFKELTSNN